MKFEINTDLVQIAKKDSSQHQDFLLIPSAKAIEAKSIEVTVSDTETKASQVFTFPIKRLPATETAVLSLNQKKAGDISAADFQKLTEMESSFPAVQQKALCKVAGYTIVYQRKGQDPVELLGTGSKFTGTVSQAIQAAKKGDTFTFKRIKLQCAGDLIGKLVPDMVFNIK